MALENSRNRSRRRPIQEEIAAEAVEEHFFRKGEASMEPEIPAEAEADAENVNDSAGSCEDFETQSSAENDDVQTEESCQSQSGENQSCADSFHAPAAAKDAMPGEKPETELVKPRQGFVRMMGSAREAVVKSMAPVFRVNYMAPAAMLLFAIMFAAIAMYVMNSRDEASSLLKNGPAEAYQLMEKGDNDEARRLWVQINARAAWYMPLAGLFFTSIDKPYLQKAALAFQAEAWDDVVENAYKALGVPITDQQAVYIQQMILTATANKVRAYLPNQEDQPVRGGVPEHAAPVCDPGSAWIWVVPVVLILIASLCLYGRMKILFVAAALAVPLYMWGISEWNSRAQTACEARLSFNPSHIELYATAENMVKSTSVGFTETNAHSFQPLTQIPKKPVDTFRKDVPATLPAQEVTLPQSAPVSE